MFWLLTLRLNSAKAGIFSALGCWAATTLQQAVRPGLRLLFSGPVLTRGQHQVELNVFTILTLRLNSAESGWLGYFQPWAETGLLHALQQASEVRLEALFSSWGCPMETVLTSRQHQLELNVLTSYAEAEFSWGQAWGSFFQVKAVVRQEAAVYRAVDWYTLEWIFSLIFFC